MTPAQQRLAARHLAAREIEHRLIVDFEGAVGQRLPQILLHGEPRLGAGVHGRLEEAVVRRPSALAAYIARSACLINWSSSVPSSGASAMPMLASVER